MLDWLIVNPDYLSALRELEHRIPYSDYGEHKFKPFFGTLFQHEGLCYISQVSHPQKRHEGLMPSLDFQKIRLDDPVGNKVRLIAVVNLNYMFPVPPRLIQPLDYSDLPHYRSFQSEENRDWYIDLLRRELEQINTLGLEDNAQQIYTLKYASPKDELSRRCIDFKALEDYAHNYPI